MNRATKLFAVIPGLITLAAGAIAIAFLVIKLLWAWTIPDLFPGAVENNYIAREISWFTSFKLALFIGVLTAMGKGYNKN